ncbi:MAG TPA: type II toxin-antitoxin system RelE/ParE family toxin [Bryobacteraceae bacterium]|jgi:mRNA-degrading endonuclease RelE of RelBE toxin-antitoxin system|nr:type II toxin-antitoxin system RelE/ParE family toxin [Bryobacteraceae bacterium]
MELLTDEEREAVRGFLAEYPEAGDIVPRLSSLRKLRWTQRSRNKGKRGGARIVYFYAVPERMVLLYAYSKDEKEDLTNADRKNLKAAADELKAAIAKDNARSHDQVGRRSGKRS